jgi:hypothetical protein
MQRRLYLPAMKRAAVLLWGEEGLDDIGRALPDDTREEFFRTVQTDEWVAVRHITGWMYAAHHGPAQLALAKTREYIDRIFDFSSGIIRRSLLRLADPATLTPRLGPLWPEDQTHGELLSTIDPGGKSATFRLTNSPFTETPHTRGGIAENYRYAYSLTRATNVTETHALERQGTLVFRIRWT